MNNQLGIYIPEELYAYCRGVAKTVLSFSMATMIQAPTHLEEQLVEMLVYAFISLELVNVIAVYSL